MVNNDIKVHIWLDTYLDNDMTDEPDSSAIEGTKISAKNTCQPHYMHFCLKYLSAYSSVTHIITVT